MSGFRNTVTWKKIWGPFPQNIYVIYSGKKVQMLFIDFFFEGNTDILAPDVRYVLYAFDDGEYAAWSIFGGAWCALTKIPPEGLGAGEVSTTSYIGALENPDVTNSVRIIYDTRMIQFYVNNKRFDVYLPILTRATTVRAHLGDTSNRSKIISVLTYPDEAYFGYYMTIEDGRMGNLLDSWKNIRRNSNRTFYIRARVGSLLLNTTPRNCFIDFFLSNSDWAPDADTYALRMMFWGGEDGTKFAWKRAGKTYLPAGSTYDSDSSLTAYDSELMPLESTPMASALQNIDNVISIDCILDTAYISVNGVFIGQITDFAIASAQVALISFENACTECEIFHFSVSGEKDVLNRLPGPSNEALISVGIFEDAAGNPITPPEIVPPPIDDGDDDGDDGDDDDGDDNGENTTLPIEDDDDEDEDDEDDDDDDDEDENKAPWWLWMSLVVAGLVMVGSAGASYVGGKKKTNKVEPE
jgi:hypothetical protein